MATNLNAELNLNPLLGLILENPYATGIFLILVLFIVIVFFIAKSGVLSIFREHQEYRLRRIKDEISDHELLLADESLNKYSDQMAYHLQIAKLNKLLKFNHHDIDLLEYILSCKNKDLAIFYYKSAGKYIEKNEVTKRFKLKSYCKDWVVTLIDRIGIFLYFAISLGSLFPMVYVVYLCVVTGESLSAIPHSFVVAQSFFFGVCLLMALMVANPLFKPWKATQFLRLEKI